MGVRLELHMLNPVLICTEWRVFPCITGDAPAPIIHYDNEQRHESPETKGFYTDYHILTRYNDK